MTGISLVTHSEIHLAIHSLLNLANLRSQGMALDSDGCVRVPLATGLGVELDWASIEPRIIAR